MVFPLTIGGGDAERSPEVPDFAVVVVVAIAGCCEVSWYLVGDFERARAPEGGLAARSLPCKFLRDLPEAEVSFLVSTISNTLSFAQTAPRAVRRCLLLLFMLVEVEENNYFDARYCR